jgi:hypothetical protein
MVNLLSINHPRQNKPKIPTRIQLQPLSPKEKALVDRFFAGLTRKNH